MTLPRPFFHSLLRPCILQILRAQGYHAARPSVVDAFTDLAARYLTLLCETTAHHTAHNSTEVSGLVPSLVDVRLALEDCALLAPGVDADDVRPITEFVDWVAGARNREIRRIALDGDDDDGATTDYLAALKKKHSKTGEDSKYSSTVLGRGNVGGGVDHGDGSVGADIVVEGGDCPSIASWREKRIEARQQPRRPLVSVREPDGDNDEEMDDDNDDDEVDNNKRRRKSRSPSSGLSSLGDRSIDEDMELEFGVAAASTTAVSTMAVKQPAKSSSAMEVDSKPDEGAAQSMAGTVSL
ncbi:hypothetical protein SCUCBS95973_008570 [Sporothrix curviconia]|uniref:Bromodomain associated domain-containing protein n=1 Tax=Sporothrix curviconia TaxID=1260050 RepID=A0ABP0CN92_9PEZI